MTASKRNTVSNSEVVEISQTLEMFGQYQRWQYLFACIPAVLITMININYIFVVGDINYRCRIPECEDTNSVFAPSWWPNTTVDRCSKPVLNPGLGGTCSNTSFSGELEKCTQWVYESNDTVIAELDLACQPWRSNLVGTIHNVGMVFALLIGGWMSDRFGRKPTLIICSVFCLIGNLKTLAKSYYVYMFLEFFEAVITGGTYSGAMVLMVEIGGRKNRVLAGMLYAFTVYFGEALFACIAMVVPNWKNLIYILYCPPALVILYTFLIKESPRWQILNGRIDEAKEALKYIAKQNKININVQELENADETKLKNMFNVGNYGKREGYVQVFKSREVTKRLIVASICRFTTSFVYYGLMINSVLLPGNKHTNFLMTTVVSFPAELMSMFLMNKLGRKLPLIYGYLLCGILCVACGYVPNQYTWLQITLFIMGKLVVSVCYTGMITYIMELFPTSVRGSLLGICAIFACTGSMIAPLTPMLNIISTALPPIFFGGFALFASALLTLMPETSEHPLYDTIDQVDAGTKLRRELRLAKAQGADNPAFSEDNKRTSDV